MDFKNFLFSFLILQLTLCILHGFYSPHQQHNRGMATLVFQPVTTGPMLPNWNISAVIGWIAMNVGTDIHGPQRINPNDLWNPSLLLLPHTEIHPFRCSCFKNKSSVVCLYSQADAHLTTMCTIAGDRPLGLTFVVFEWSVSPATGWSAFTPKCRVSRLLGA